MINETVKMSQGTAKLAVDDGQGQKCCLNLFYPTYAAPAVFINTIYTGNICKNWMSYNEQGLRTGCERHAVLYIEFISNVFLC